LCKGARARMQTKIHFLSIMIMESKEFMKPQAHNFIVVAQNLDTQPSTATWKIITRLKSDLHVPKIHHFCRRRHNHQEQEQEQQKQEH